VWRDICGYTDGSYPQVGHDRLGRRERQRHDAALVGGPRALQRDDPDIRPGDQVSREIVQADLDQFGPPDAFGEHPEHRVVAGVLEGPRA
jgi:hypothetical protein